MEAIIVIILLMISVNWTALVRSAVSNTEPAMQKTWRVQSAVISTESALHRKCSSENEAEHYITNGKRKGRLADVSALTRIVSCVTCWHYICREKTPAERAREAKHSSKHSRQILLVTIINETVIVLRIGLGLPLVTKRPSVVSQCRQLVKANCSTRKSLRLAVITSSVQQLSEASCVL